MKEKKIEVIKCPCCGTEYLPGEIYLPNWFLGQPKDIERKYDTGEIVDFTGDSMDLTECFICERCNSPFKVVAKVSFTTTEEKMYNFNEDYSSPLKKESLFLNED